MQISKLNTVPIYVSPMDTKLIANDSKALSFSTLMHGIIDDKTISAQETATQKQSDSSCDCEKSMKPCKCESDKETEEVPEVKKSGIAACMDCAYRKSGQCAMWNGENKDGIFNLLSADSYNDATQAYAAKRLDIQAHLDVMSKASTNYDYANAYASIRKKFKNINIQ